MHDWSSEFDVNEEFELGLYDPTPSSSDNPGELEMDWLSDDDWDLVEASLAADAGQ